MGDLLAAEQIGTETATPAGRIEVGVPYWYLFVNRLVYSLLKDFEGCGLVIYGLNKLLRV